MCLIFVVLRTLAHTHSAILEPLILNIKLHDIILHDITILIIIISIIVSIISIIIIIIITIMLLDMTPARQDRRTWQEIAGSERT